MNPMTMEKMRWFVGRYIGDRPCLVLDVGSYDVNGCHRELFGEGQVYIGLDIEAGPNVDTVQKPYRWDLTTDSFDFVISGQTFEHVEFPWETMREMVRVLKKGGKLCVIAPNTGHEHRFPVDCYRYFTDGFVAIARYYGLDIDHASVNCGYSRRWATETHADAMLVATKPYRGKARVVDVGSYECVPADHAELCGDMKMYRWSYLAGAVRHMIEALKHYARRR